MKKMNKVTLARKLQCAATNWDYGAMLHVYSRFTEPCLMPNGIVDIESTRTAYLYKMHRRKKHFSYANMKIEVGWTGRTVTETDLPTIYLLKYGLRCIPSACLCRRFFL